MSSRFTVTPAAVIDALKVIQRLPVQDDRGYLERMYCAGELAAMGLAKPVVQINRTLTRMQGAVRGLHFQYPPFAEAKLIACLRGEIFDVAVDLRRGSPTYLQWHAEILSAENHRSLLIPEGFAHGFQTLTPDCELLYLHTESYHPEAEGGLNCRDPRLAIAWPLEITDLSQRDAGHPLLGDSFRGIDR